MIAPPAQCLVKLLIVDDSPSDRGIFVRYLQSHPQPTYHFLEADSLEAGLALWQSQKPDIVLLDFQLPDGNGLDFLSMLRTHHCAAQLPVIVVTGQGNERVAVQAMKLGAADYLSKDSLTENDLCNSVQHIYDRTATLQADPDQTLQAPRSSLLAVQAQMLDQIHDAVISTGLDGTIQSWNLGAERLYGYTAAEAIGQNIRLLYLPEDWHILETDLFPPLLDKGTHEIELRNCTKSGIPIYISLRLLVIRDEAGQAIRLMGCSNDITQQKQAEAQLQQLNQELEAEIARRTQQLWQANSLQKVILDGADYAIISIDLKGVIQTFNLAAERMLGYQAVEAIGQDFLELVFDRQEIDHHVSNLVTDFEQDVPSGFEILVAQARQGLLNEDEWTYIRKDGSRFPVLLSMSAIRDYDQTIIGFLSIAEDITEQQAVLQERKQAEALLRKSEAHLAAAQRIARLGSWEFDLTTYEIRWSEETYQIFGRPIHDGPPSFTEFLAYIHPDDRLKVRQVLQVVIEQAYPFEAEYRVCHPDGGLCYVLSRAELLIGEAEQTAILVGTVIDISEQKLAEETLRHSEAINRALIEAIPDLLVRMRQDGFHLQVFNEGAIHVLEIGGSLIGHWVTEVMPDAIAQERIQMARRAIQTGQVQRHEYQFVDEGQTYYEEARVAPLGEDEVLVVVRDITDRKKAEEQLLKTNQELARATRLKDEFLANMSHELRTPLNAILGMAEALQDEVLGALSPRQQQAITTIDRSGRHLLELINDILDLAKISSGQVDLHLDATSVHNLCDSSLLFVKQQAFKKNIQITSQIPPNLPSIRVDERRIRQVLINLLINAVKFTPEGGQVSLTVAVSSGDIWIGPAKVPEQLTSHTPPWILFQVTDTGIGITPENLKQLFQPFVQLDNSLNRQQTGTGLGLAVVKQITELHDGQIFVDSSPDQGSRFTIALPYHQAITGTGSPECIQAPSTPGTAPAKQTIAPLILLVEDNEDNITTFMAYLSAHHYRLILAKSGNAAITLVRQQPPDLILMDIQMPGMDGLETIRQIRSEESLAAIPIIALTALAMPGDKERCLAAGADQYLTKPVSLKHLVQTIRQFLEPPAVGTSQRHP